MTAVGIYLFISLFFVVVGMAEKLSLYLQGDSPSARQIPAVGIYLFISLFFVVVGMAEFSILLFLLRRSDNIAYKRRLLIKSIGKSNTESPHEPIEDRRNASTNPHSLNVPFENHSFDFISYASKIDFTAMIIFPVTFTLFNITYWLHYLK